MLVRCVCVLALLFSVSSSSRAQRTSSCIAIELQLPTADTMLVAMQRNRCGPLRVVITKPPTLVALPAGMYRPERVFTLDIAMENTSDTAISLPITMLADSSSFVRHGRTLSRYFVHAYASSLTWTDGGNPGTWRFTAPPMGDTRLAPGARTAPRTISLQTSPLATGFILWMSLDAGPSSRRYEWVAPPPLMALSAPAQALVEAMQLPKLRSAGTVYVDSTRALEFFLVSYGDGQDCPGGCFYSNAIGVRHGSRVGWISTDNYQKDTALDARLARAAYRLTPADDYLLSAELAESLARLHLQYSYALTETLQAISVASPRIPRERLVALIGELYGGRRDGLVHQLLAAPAVRGDPELLTLLGFLPRGFDGERFAAQRLLAAQAPALLANPRTPTRTLFAMTLGGGYAERDSVIVRTIVAHPNARNSPAILAQFAWRFPEVHPLILAALDVPRDIEVRLAYILVMRDQRVGELARELLADGIAGRHLGVLTVLASVAPQEQRWAACRRLPEDGLCPDDWPFRPIDAAEPVNTRR